MSYPLPVREMPLRTPAGHATNISATITPPSLRHFDYFVGFTVTSGAQLRVLNTAGHGWWLTERPDAPMSGSFSTAFASAFHGGVDSPQGSAFNNAFSSAFGQ